MCKNTTMIVKQKKTVLIILNVLLQELLNWDCLRQLGHNTEQPSHEPCLLAGVYPSMNQLRCRSAKISKAKFCEPLIGIKDGNMSIRRKEVI